MDNFINTVIQKQENVLNTRESDDFIVNLFNQGFHHILEKIVLDFPLKTIQDCKNVSPDWCRIVLHFHTSKIPVFTR